MSEQPDLLLPTITSEKTTPLLPQIMAEQSNPTVQAIVSEDRDAVKELRGIFQQIFTDKPDATDNHNKPILIALDTGRTKQGRFNTIGVSLLDTHCFIGTSALRPSKIQASFWTHTYVFDRSRVAQRLGCRALFNGEAQKVSWTDRYAVLAHIFAHHEEKNTDSRGTACKFQPFQLCQENQSYGPLRPIIIVGHDLVQDYAALRKAGLDIAHAAPVLTTLDTQKLTQSIFWPEEPEPEQPSLKKSCRLVRISFTKNLHHSGNDAAYTLLVLLGLASKILDDGSEKGSASKILTKLVQRMMESCKTTRQLIQDRYKITKSLRDEIKMRGKTGEQKICPDWADNLVADGTETSVFATLF